MAYPLGRCYRPPSPAGQRSPTRRGDLAAASGELAEGLRAWPGLLGLRQAAAPDRRGTKATSALAPRPRPWHGSGAFAQRKDPGGTHRGSAQFCPCWLWTWAHHHLHQTSPICKMGLITSPRGRRGLAWSNVGPGGPAGGGGHLCRSSPLPALYTAELCFRAFLKDSFHQRLSLICIPGVHCQ